MGLAPSALLDSLTCQWEAFRLDTLSYAASAEPIARAQAQSGNPLDVKRLASVLMIKAGGLREIGRQAEGLPDEIEALRLLDELADAGDDNALLLLQGYAGIASIHACGAATGQRYVARFVSDLGPLPEPETIPLEPLPPFPPITRRERLIWWCQDRWDDLRAWCRDPLWELRILWWSISDRIRGLK